MMDMVDAVLVTDAWALEKTTESMLGYIAEECEEVRDELRVLGESLDATVASRDSSDSRGERATAVGGDGGGGGGGGGSGGDSGGGGGGGADVTDLEGELGDLLFDTLMAIGMAARDRGAAPGRVYASMDAKLRRRCAHVFEAGHVNPRTREEAEQLWNEGKAKEAAAEAAAGGPGSAAGAKKAAKAKAAEAAKAAKAAKAKVNAAGKGGAAGGDDSAVEAPGGVSVAGRVDSLVASGTEKEKEKEKGMGVEKEKEQAQAVLAAAAGAGAGVPERTVMLGGCAAVLFGLVVGGLLGRLGARGRGGS